MRATNHEALHKQPFEFTPKQLPAKSYPNTHSQIKPKQNHTKPQALCGRGGATKRGEKPLN